MDYEEWFETEYKIYNKDGNLIKHFIKFNDNDNKLKTDIKKQFLKHFKNHYKQSERYSKKKWDKLYNNVREKIKNCYKVIDLKYAVKDIIDVYNIGNFEWVINQYDINTLKLINF